MAEEMAMQTNIEFVQKLYQAFLDRRIDVILNHCSESVTWDCVGNPAWVPHAGVAHGRDSVQRFFNTLEQVYTIETFSPDSFHAAGDWVFCFGHEKARANATGKPIENRFLHSFRVENGQLAAFTEFTDTAAVAVGAGTLQPAKEGMRAA
jgi:ketosteroid isomerase-like protein